MQQLTDGTNPTAERCAAAVLATGLAVTRFVRSEMWRARREGMTLPQFRALAYVDADPACSPSVLADHLMSSRPAVTRLLDELVRRGLLERQPDEQDRRRQLLRLTVEGRRRLEDYFRSVRSLLAERLAPLTAAEQDVVAGAMERVLPVFGGVLPAKAVAGAGSERGGEGVT